MNYDKASVRRILDRVKAEGRVSLAPDEATLLCEAYGISMPREGIAKSAVEAGRVAAEIGFPVVMKVVSPDILHKTEAAGVVVGVKTKAEAEQTYEQIVRNAEAYNADATVSGVQVQQMLAGGHEVIVGALTDSSFGKVVAFGLGGVLVEVFKDVTFRLAPTTEAEALTMVSGIAAAEILRGVRGGAAVDRDAIARIITAVSTSAIFPKSRRSI
jgi:acyl-CoA synthetase (NDP forming)